MKFLQVHVNKGLFYYNVMHMWLKILFAYQQGDLIFLNLDFNKDIEVTVTISSNHSGKQLLS